MASAREFLTHVLVAALFVGLPTSVMMAEGHCECCEETMQAVEDLQERFRTLGIQVSEAVNLSHRFNMLKIEVLGEIKRLKGSVHALQNKGPNILSNLLDAIPGTGRSEVDKRIQEDESEIRRIQADVNEMKADRNSLREAVERVKRDLSQDRLQTNQSIAAVHAKTKFLAEVFTPEIRNLIASLPKKLAKIERLEKAGYRVMKLLSSSEKESEQHETFQGHGFDSENGKNLPTHIASNNASSDMPIETNTGDENDGAERQSYPPENLLVANHSSNSYHNVFVRDIQSAAAGNKTYAATNFSHTFISGASTNQSAFGAIREIQFVGSDGNFSIMMRDIDGGGTEYVPYNDTATTTQSVPCGPFSACVERNDDEQDSIELPIEHVMNVMAEQLLHLQKSFKDVEWDSRLSQLENNSARVNANLSNLHELVVSQMEPETDVATEPQLVLSNVSDVIKEALLKFEERVLTELEGRTVENARKANDAWEGLQNVSSKVEEIELNLASTGAKEDSFRLINDSLTTLRAQVLALRDSANAAGPQDIIELTSQLRNLNMSLQIPMADFDRRIQECLSLNRALKQSVDNVTSWLEVASENANKSAIVGDLKLHTRIDELKQAFSAEHQKFKASMENMTELISRLNKVQGWHPDDTADCPGMNALAADEHLVLSMDSRGRFRAPNLPRDSIPIGSVVRFHCVPAGSHRLVGERELTCLNGRRWSSPPPTCEPLPTLEQMLANSSSPAVPSIAHEDLVDDEWASTDDEGRLIVRPGRRLRLKCLYPQHKGTVSWLHNGTLPRGATSEWTRENLDGRALHSYRMEIGSARPHHSGTYSCETEDGRRHSISIKIADVNCEKPTTPLNGDVEASSPGPIPVGEKVKFRCSMGYNLSGTEELTCLGSGRWSSQPPTCKEMETFVPPEGVCQRPAVPEGLLIKPDRKWYETGNRVRYSCEGGRLIGTSSHMCYEGQWTGRVPSCM